jgi:hypothetical protein
VPREEASFLCVNGSLRALKVHLKVVHDVGVVRVLELTL